MALFPISEKSQAYVDGYRNGQLDRSIGIVKFFIVDIDTNKVLHTVYASNTTEATDAAINWCRVTGNNQRSVHTVCDECDYQNRMDI